MFISLHDPAHHRMAAGVLAGKLLEDDFQFG